MSVQVATLSSAMTRVVADGSTTSDGLSGLDNSRSVVFGDAKARATTVSVTSTPTVMAMKNRKQRFSVWNEVE